MGIKWIIEYIREITCKYRLERSIEENKGRDSEEIR